MVMEETNLGLACMFSRAMSIMDRYLIYMYSKKKKFLKNVSFCSLLPVVNTAHFRTSYKLIEK